MKTLFRKIFILNWPRKLISFLLAIGIWMTVTYYMTSSKTIHKVPIKVINLPSGKTIEGLNDDNFLKQKINITLTGNRNTLEEISESDLNLVIDAKEAKDEWSVVITPKNIVCLNPDIDIQKNIIKVSHAPLNLRLSNLTTQRIPILITQPIGESPKGYLYLDVWPYQLYVTIKGPQKAVKSIKSKGLKLTFNLNDISEKDLKAAASSSVDKDSICFLIPESWKKLNLPSISSSPIVIDDPQSKALRIDFAKNELIPIDRPLPITLFFPAKTISSLNPDTCTLGVNDFIQKKNGIFLISEPLYAYGVSKLFLDTVKDMIQLVIIATVHNSKEAPLWNPQFIYPHELEDRYVAKVLLESVDQGLDNFHPQLNEEYLRNRFRAHMNRFRLYSLDNKKLSLDIRLDGNTIQVSPLKK